MNLTTRLWLAVVRWAARDITRADDMLDAIERQHPTILTDRHRDMVRFVEEMRARQERP